MNAVHKRHFTILCLPFNKKDSPHRISFKKNRYEAKKTRKITQCIT